MRILITAKLKRATLFVALFFSAAVSAKPAPRENHRDIIEKAQNLSLQKDRSQAVQLLKLAIRKESKKSVAYRELGQAIVDLSNLFLSEKSQQLYELGLSLWMSDPGMAQNKLAEALKNEPDNLMIEMALARISIAQNECAATADRLAKYKELQLYIEELRLLYGQIAICRGQFEDYPPIKELGDPKGGLLHAFWTALEMEYLFKKKAFSKILEIVNSEEKQSRHPEHFYWAWRAQTEMKQKAERMGQKYLNMCKTLGSRQLRDLVFDPNLCRRTTEVETYLKKNNNPEA